MEREIREISPKITHYAQLGNSDFIGNWDLPEDGSPIRVTIEKMDQETVFNKGKRKKEWVDVIRMVGKTKGFIVNKTNKESIASWHGSNFHKWPGKEIQLFRTTDRLKSDIVDCIRVVKNDKKRVADASSQASAAAQ